MSLDGNKRISGIINRNLTLPRAFNIDYQFTQLSKTPRLRHDGFLTGNFPETPNETGRWKSFEPDLCSVSQIMESLDTPHASVGTVRCLVPLDY